MNSEIFTTCLLLCIVQGDFGFPGWTPYSYYVKKNPTSEYRDRYPITSKNSSPYKYKTYSYANTSDILKNPYNFQSYPLAYPKKYENDSKFRFDFGGEEYELCKSRVVKIRATPDQLKDPFWQSFFTNGASVIEGEECVNEGGSCGLKLPGITTRCVQKYTNKVKFSAEGVEDDYTYKVPTGCICTFKIK